MEALTISAANLETIERNLGTVANELSGVIHNVMDVNDQVNKVEEKVASLNDEIKGLVQEIRETTIITNARQNIMYNNELIERKYGYYDRVRRNVLSLLDSIKNSRIRKASLLNLREELLLNSPNYWLANALAALISWIMDDREGASLELNNALRKNDKKTSIFFALVYLELGRMNTAQHWLEKYLSNQNPMNIDKDFVTVLDLVTAGVFGMDTREMVMNKLDDWFKRLNSNQDIQNNQIELFTEYIQSWEETEVVMPRLEGKTPDIDILKNNLAITSSYNHVLKDLKDITYQERTSKSVSDVLHDLIYDYEGNEQSLNKDNLRNRFIIECNGDLQEANRLYKQQEHIYDEKMDVISMLSNIVVYKDNFNVSNETQMVALSLVYKYILEAYEKRNKKINLDAFTISVLGFTTKTVDGTNGKTIHDEIQAYLYNTYEIEDKDLFVFLLIVDILGIVGIFITLKNKILCTVLILILIFANILLFYKLCTRKKIRNRNRMTTENILTNEIEKVLAETVDYRNMIRDDMEKYDDLVDYLTKLDVKQYIKHQNERILDIGGKV